MLESIQDFVWGWPTIIAVVGTGLYLSVRTGFVVVRRIGLAIRLLTRSRHSDGVAGEISPAQSLMTAMSATIGTGNIAGVATAIAIGGPGAIFWMWVTALVGMTTKYAEAVLAVRYRRVGADHSFHGGPMYYIREGLGRRWRWLAVAFAFFGAVAAFGIGNTVQANAMAHALADRFDISPAYTAAVLLVLVSIVVIGGVKRIGAVASAVVPAMSMLYITVGLAVLVTNYQNLPEAFSLIFRGAFTDLEPAAGGLAGYGLAEAVRYGVARGVFSNEAGLGSAPIAHACARTDNPVRQGLLASLGTFIDTIILCSVTALIILTGEQWLARSSSGEAALTGAALTLGSVADAIGGAGASVVAVALTLFAFTTILGWSVYGEKCLVYLFGARAVKPFRIAWVLASPLGALVLLSGTDTTTTVEQLWRVSDILNALMALPNLIALVLLTPVVVAITRANPLWQRLTKQPPTPD